MNKLLLLSRTLYRSLWGFLYIIIAPRSFVKTGSSFWKGYFIQKKNNNFETKILNLFPLLGDNSTDTPLDPIYFFQNSWCAKKIFETYPVHHYDVGSSAHLVGIISQFVSTTMIDIRPLPLQLDNLQFLKGSILKLPFEDNSVASLSSICVIEHIGLGRYGDPFDALGSEKAIGELIRVLAPGGNLFISIPVDSNNNVYYNAHRSFTRDYILNLFSGFILCEEKYIYKLFTQQKYEAIKGFGTGLFYFKKK